MDNEIVSTLMTPGLEFYTRQVGNSTKQIDYAIQLLFAGKTVKCEDHYDGGGSKSAKRKMDEMLLDRILRRFNLEHKRCVNKVEIDKAQLTIRLK